MFNDGQLTTGSKPGQRGRPPLASIIVLNWNGRNYLADCLASLASQTWPAREFILVDNGSTDGSDEIIRHWAEGRADTRTLFLDKNTGFTRGNNLAFAQARGEWIALINNDAIAQPDWLEHLVRRGDLENRVGMLGGKILFAHAPNTIDKAGHLIYPDGLNRGRGTMETDTGQYDGEEEILWPDACAALYHRDLIAETGGFDEAFFAYGDDADLGLRARLLGWRAGYVPEALVFHRHSASSGAYAPRKAMLVERNRILLAVKNFPLALLWQNPFWTVRRYLWNIYGAMRGQGSAGRFVDEHGRVRLLLTLFWAYGSAIVKLPGAFASRRRIQRNKRLTDAEVLQLLERFRIDVRELTLRE